MKDDMFKIYPEGEGVFFPKLFVDFSYYCSEYLRLKKVPDINDRQPPSSIDRRIDDLRSIIVDGDGVDADWIFLLFPPYQIELFCQAYAMIGVKRNPS